MIPIKTARIRTLFTRVTAAALLSLAPLQGRSASDLTNDLDAFVERAMALGATPGLAVAVVRDTGIVYAKGFGFADREAGRRATADTQCRRAAVLRQFQVARQSPCRWRSCGRIVSPWTFWSRV